MHCEIAVFQVFLPKIVPSTIQVLISKRINWSAYPRLNFSKIIDWQRTFIRQSTYQVPSCMHERLSCNRHCTRNLCKYRLAYHTDDQNCKNVLESFPVSFCFWTRHNVRKSRNMNKAKQVSNFLICGGNNVVEHHPKKIKILHGCPFEG